MSAVPPAAAVAGSSSPHGAPQAHVTGMGAKLAWRFGAKVIATLAGLFVLADALRHIGAADYGAYVLVAMVTGLFSIFDVPLSMGVVRAIAKDRPWFSPDQAARSRTDANASSSLYSMLGVAAIGATLVLAFVLPLLPSLSRVPHAALRSTVVLVGCGAAISLATSAWSGVLLGRQRFDVLAQASLAQTVVRVLLVVVLLGHLGLVSLGIAQLVAVVVGRIVILVYLRRAERWFALLPGRARRQDLARVGSLALPLLAVALSGPVLSATDSLVVGGLATAAAVALYRVGVIVPNQAAAFLFAGYDSSYPGLAGDPSPVSQEEVVRFLTRVTSFVAGAGFALLVALRGDLVTLLVGRLSALASDVLVLFSAVWMINIPVHCVNMLLIARGRQKRLVRFSIYEIAGNIVLTVILVVTLGPVGAALATLVTVVVSNGVVFPLLFRGELESSVARLLFVSGLGSACLGVLAASAGAVPVLALWHSGAGAAIMAATCAAAISGAVLAGFLGQDGRRRFAGIVRSVQVTSGDRPASDPTKRAKMRERDAVGRS
jgi:O-antigen/teichoic acid export membrane protein